MAYNSANNITVSVDEISETGTSLTIKDENPYKREAEFSHYELTKRTGNTLESLTKDINAITSIKIDETTIKSTYHWEDICGKLKNGEYQFRTSTSNYYITIYIDFVIDENGNITYAQPMCSIM